ncbi:MAG: WS/DGAT domain-containing protein, partial [Pseudomonadota bacterium]|nr:WS/DGAT domain-containing protein [Pseudomonadota bacterium]
IVQQGRGLADNPQEAVGAVQEVARKGVGFATELARLALMGRDASTRFKGALGERKRVAWAEPLPLDEVRIVGKALGCSINDVLLSMAAGALRDYLLDKGDAVDGIEIRAIVPVNLRPAGASRSLGNKFGLVFLDLPIGTAHPLERLYEVRHRMLALKGSYQPIIALGLLNAVGYGPKALQQQVTALLGNSASAVMTNVPGPQKPLYFAGKRIVELDFWVPQSGGIGMGVSILSYDGRIQFGVITDAGLVPDPDAIVGRFADEFNKLMWVTLMSPWGVEAAAEAAPARPTADVVPETSATRSTQGKVPKRFRNL